MLITLHGQIKDLVQPWNKKTLTPWKKSYNQPRQHIKKQTLPTKICLVKGMVFLVIMYRCESWTIKKAECQRIDAFEMWCCRRLKSPLDSKELKSVNPKGNQYWIFIGRTDAEAETPILWPPNAKRQLIGKDSDAGKDWGQKERGANEDEIVGWYH